MRQRLVLSSIVVCLLVIVSSLQFITAHAAEVASSSANKQLLKPGDMGMMPSSHVDERSHTATNPFSGTNGKSLNWGGYIMSFTNNQNTPLSVSGAWTVPSISCTRNGKPISGYVYVWDGLGGYQPGNTLEQIGTGSQCNKGNAYYWAWYEFVPSMPHPHLIMNDGNYPISPGDAMRADVTDQGYGYFVLRIFDDTKGWYYVKIWINQNANATPQNGEWIVEDPANGTLPFPQFYDVLFTNCYWVQNSPQETLITGPSLLDDPIYTDFFGNPVNPIKETTLDVFPNGTDFSIYWNHF